MTNLIYATNYLGGGERFEVHEVHNHLHVYGVDPFGLIFLALGALILLVWRLVLGRKKLDGRVE